MSGFIRKPVHLSPDALSLDFRVMEASEVVTRFYLTLGALLEWFDNGTAPLLDEVVSLAEAGGDLLLLVTNARDKLLVDNRLLAAARWSGNREFADVMAAYSLPVYSACVAASVGSR